MKIENKKTKAILGKAVVNGEVAHAAKIQAQRVLNIFNPNSSTLEGLPRVRGHKNVAEFSAEVYLFLLAVNQLAILLDKYKRPKKQFLTDQEIIDIKHMRNIWEHHHPATSKLSLKWFPKNKAQKNWLESTFPGNHGKVYEIHADTRDVYIAGIISVQKVLQEASFWVDISQDFSNPELLWFPNQEAPLHD